MIVVRVGMGRVTVAGGLRRWLVAGLVSLVALVLASWLSGALVLPRLLPSGDARWPAALGIGAAAAAFAGLWGQSWASAGVGKAKDAADPASRSVAVAGDNPSADAAGRAACTVVGEIPQEPLGFQPRADLLALLDGPGRGVRVVRA
jgi:hypothetical protein